MNKSELVLLQINLGTLGVAVPVGALDGGAELVAARKKVSATVLKEFDATVEKAREKWQERQG